MKKPKIDIMGNLAFIGKSLMEKQEAEAYEEMIDALIEEHNELKKDYKEAMISVQEEMLMKRMLRIQETLKKAGCEL